MSNMASRLYFREPIPELAQAARTLDEAVTAHLQGDTEAAAERIHSTNSQVLRDWIDSLWGKKSPHVLYRKVPDAPPHIPRPQRAETRMPSSLAKLALIERDGFHCRVCGIPLIRAEVRAKMARVYPKALPWGSSNKSQHAAFQALWLQYDHILPHARGGLNDPCNMIVACAGCNYCRWHYTLEEVGLSDPRGRAPVRSNWDGLERFG
jgi:5-methylcytosine-specific restriction endonuclease McrA